MEISGTRAGNGRTPYGPGAPGGFSAPALATEGLEPPPVGRPLERDLGVHRVEGGVAAAGRAAGRAPHSRRGVIAVHRDVGHLPVGLHVPARTEERLEVRLL